MVDQFKYLVLFISLFSFLCGLIYNEIFGLPMNIFGTKWELDPTNENNLTSIYKQRDSHSIYPFGLDPEWFFKDNELLFMNSYKMKLAIVMGMCQMFFGLALQLINHIKRRDITSLLVSFLPEVMYMVPFFGYLAFIIIKKWNTEFDGNSEERGVDLIQIMIGLVLNMGKTEDSLTLFSGQITAQTIILVLFLVSIPYFLFAKPAVEIFRKWGTPQCSVLEIFVMNLIHVIEFCLSALSHTASYLRLWALSLAHSQLSHVLFEQLIVRGIEMNFFVLLVAFALFGVLSAAILLGMEGFSALLHAIRLMWVEFSSKFYEGTGHSFAPISIKEHFKSNGLK